MHGGEIIGGLILKNILLHRGAKIWIALKNDLYNDHGYEMEDTCF